MILAATLSVGNATYEPAVPAAGPQVEGRGDAPSFVEVGPRLAKADSTFSLQINA